MREKRLLYNTISSLAFQIITVICGFILPRLILSHFGSSVNGVVNSISQFLQIVAFLDLGVGAVIQSALYKPLAQNDRKSISEIAASADRFFSNIAKILLGYVVILTVVFPIIVRDEYSFQYSASLIIAMSISTFSQYYFGMFDKLFLMADQRGYIQYNAQSVTLILNTIASAVLIQFGCSIQIVRASTSLIYMLRPIYLRWYVKQHYDFDRKVKYSGEPIKQKWNGLAQHIASVVLENTDNIVLTVFSTLASVSIYSVYHLVIYGVKNLFTVMSNGFQSFWGDMWSREEYDALRSSFEKIEWMLHMSCVFIFGCTACLVVPFVQIYTRGVTDADYYQPFFAIVLTAAHGMHCMRLPYHILIKAVGHYKQTQNNYILAMILNLTISIIVVKFMGVIGVAAGTLIAMVYQTVWMVWYDQKNILKNSKNTFIKLILADVAITVISSVISALFKLGNLNYFAWGILALKVVAVWTVVMILMNLVLYLNNVKWMSRYLKRKFQKN